MFTRKSLFVALTVIAMLAMLVPVAMAAPETVTGVVITAPTEAAPVFAKSPGSFTVKYTINVAGQQARAVFVDFRLINEYGQDVQYWGNPDVAPIPAGTLVNGANNLTYTFNVPAGLPDGFYSVKVCIDDGIDPYCTTQKRAVLIDNTKPSVVLERPARVEGCAWVTGNQYELFGQATDNVAVDHAWFQYAVFPDGFIDEAAQPITIGNEDANFEGQNATPVAGFPGEFTAVWDSSLVDDTDWGFIRFCAVDTAGNENCTPWVRVCIENRVKVDLVKGWNLISTPLLLYNGSTADVMKHVWDPRTDTLWATSPIDKIYAYSNGGNPAWTWWGSGANDPKGVDPIQDGSGYWVHTVAPASIEFVGTWLSIGPVAPPEYAVKAGWNLIGYTHWGTPTDHGNNQSVQEYLGYPMSFSVESMYRYDAAHGYYIQVYGLGGEQFMKQGVGYWLALAEGTEGTINP